MDFRWAFVDRVSAGNEKLAEVLAAEADILGRLRRGDDEVDPARLIANLDAEGGGDIEAAFAVHAEAACFILIIPVIEFVKRLGSYNSSFIIECE